MSSFHVKLSFFWRPSKDDFDDFLDRNYTLIGREGNRWDASKLVKSTDMITALKLVAEEVSGLVDKKTQGKFISSKIYGATVSSEEEWVKAKSAHEQNFEDDEKVENFHEE